MDHKKTENLGVTMKPPPEVGDTTVCEIVTARICGTCGEEICDDLCSSTCPYDATHYRSKVFHAIYKQTLEFMRYEEVNSGPEEVE